MGRAADVVEGTLNLASGKVVTHRASDSVEALQDLARGIAERDGRPCGQLMGNSHSASVRSIHSMRVASRGMLILMAARQAMEAAISLRRSSKLA